MYGTHMSIVATKLYVLFFFRYQVSSFRADQNHV